MQAQRCCYLKHRAGSGGVWESETALVSIVSVLDERSYFHSPGKHTKAGQRTLNSFFFFPPRSADYGKKAIML